MIYLDYNASTPVDPRVTAAMVGADELFANPASVQHLPGQAAAEVVEHARHRVASLVSRPARDVVFTSGASEAATIGLLGAMLADPLRPNVVVTDTEHKAVLAAASLGARLTGGSVRSVRVGGDGTVDVDHLRDLIDSSVSVVAVMAANNETGVLGPKAEVVSTAAHDNGALHFSDLTQLVGKADVKSDCGDIDIMVLSSHKIYGPKGGGALIASRHVQKVLTPVVGGGGQEHGLRGGTHNTQGIIGLGVAAELASEETANDLIRITALKDRLLTGILEQVDDVTVNSKTAECLSNTLNLHFAGADAESVMAVVPEVAMSAGSACQSAVPTPSHVLIAMGLSHQEAAESVRISLGRPTTQVEVDEAVDLIADAVAKVRRISARTGH